MADSDAPLKHYAVIGSPITHSLSPLMHNTAFDVLDYPGVYTAFDVTAADLPEFCQWAKSGDLDGFNVTLPLKQAIIPFLDKADETVVRAQSCNTVRVENGALIGTTTDAQGLLDALGPLHAAATLALIGCGGAVQGVLPALAERVAHIALLNRTLEKAQVLAQHYDNVQAMPLDAALPPETTWVIQGTSLGLKSDDPLPYDAEKIPKTARVLDMIYSDTPFLKACRKAQIQCRNGLEMLIGQGIAALAFWLGETVVNPQREALRETVRTTLKEAMKRSR